MSTTNRGKTMKKPTEKFYIVAERNNPQLGTYLSNVFVGTKRVNKKSITCQFDDGCSRSLKFGLVGYGEFHNHNCISSESCVYGSMVYRGFDTAHEAQIYLDRTWPSSNKYEKCSKLLKDF